MNQQIMRGVFAVPTTPFRADGSQNIDSLVARVGEVLDAGVTGVLCLGATGEALALSPQERDEQVKAIVDAAAGRARVVVGCMGYTPAEVSSLVTQAATAGADAVMVTPPFYGGLEPDSAVAALHSVMSVAELPVMVYNNPHSTGTDLRPEHLATLLDTETFWSVKETSGGAARVRELRAELGEQVEVFVGADGIALEGLTQGASGWVAASAWLLPGACQRLWELARDGQWAEAVSLWDRLAAPLGQIEDNPAFISLIKQTLGRLGTEQGPVRSPLPTAPQHAVDTLVTTLETMERSSANV